MENPLDLKAIIRNIAHLLPTQGPIDVFVHHNTLHAFEEQNFEDAVISAGQVYGAEIFLREERYLEEYSKQRITESDLDHVLGKKLTDKSSLWGITSKDIIKRFLILAPSVEGFQQVKWLLRESPEMTKDPKLSKETLLTWISQNKHHSNELFSLNYEAAQGLATLIEGLPSDASITHSRRFVLWAATLLEAAHHAPPQQESVDYSESVLDDEMINPILIRFAEEYLDLGFSDQLLPGREAGMLQTFLNLIEKAHYALPKWLEPIIFELALYRKQTDSIELLTSLLSDFRIDDDQRYNFLLKEALTLKGWAGYVALAETHPEVLHSQENDIKPKLAEFLAIRLILKKYAQRSARYHTKRRELTHPSNELYQLDTLYCFAYHLLHLVSDLGIAEEFLRDTNGARQLVELTLEYSEVKRRQIWHLAYEENFYSRALNALTHHHRPPPCHPIAQFAFCLDDREESIRRHLESQNAAYQTFGTAGFFGVDANYTQLSGSSAPHCPVIIKPTHAIREIPKQGAQEKLSRFQRKQQLWFRIAGYVNRGSGSYLHSAILALAGCLSFIPMVLGVIAPRGLQYLTKLLGSEPAIPADLAELQIESKEFAESGLPGYTLEEMADRVASVLKGSGVIEQFADLFFLFGHGSSSRNNPLRSAYDCGACGGRPGKMNPRAFSMMANQASVRELILSRHGISIPERTYFVAGFHNTCSDVIEYFDLDKVPTHHQSLLAEILPDIKEATRQNALERCRRFALAQAKNSNQAAQEALSRSLMLAEARPEYNHATNALCIVGPRDLTTRLFLDRRSFLVSYDSTIDPESAILHGLLKAVVPVCGGINLEYLFSTMDNEVYGAGTKLPHNIVSLVGLMNGTSSDLRTGLPSQMVEIHEPVRLLVIVAASKEQMNTITERDDNIRRAFDNEWLKLVVWDVGNNNLDWRLSGGNYQRFTPSQEELPQISQYRDWFLGKSDHLNFAEIRTTGAGA